MYELFPNFIFSILFPVNESIWEHMKLLFGSIIVSGIIQKLIIIYRKGKVNNICFRQKQKENKLNELLENL